MPSIGLRYPLCIRRRNGDAKHLVRTILGVDQARQSKLFAGDIPHGSVAQLMRATFDKLVGGAVEAASLARAHAQAAGALAALAVSCVGRRLVLGEHVEDEPEVPLDRLPPGTHQFGFCSYGGISPYSTGSCDLHNQTMMLSIISERQPCRARIPRAGRPGARHLPRHHQAQARRIGACRQRGPLSCPGGAGVQQRHPW